MAKYYGNKATHVAHNSRKKDACRLSEIKSSNRKAFDSVGALEEENYRLCKKCKWDKEDLT